MTVSLDHAADLAQLEALGLDQTALDVYRALLEDPDADEPALAQSLHLDADTLRSTMQRLRDLQLLVQTWALPHQEHAVQPSAGIRALLERHRAELTRQQAALQRTEAVATTIAEQLSERLATRDGSEVEILRGRLRANSRVSELAASAKESFWCLNTSDLSDPMPSFDKGPDRGLLERGVKMRTIYRASVAHKKVATDLFEWYRSMGAETRILPTIPMRVLIYDGKIAIMPLDPDDPIDAAVVHTSPAVVRLAMELFKSYWSRATDSLAGESAAEPDSLTPREAELIHLLAEGATDEQVARQFGVSLRTVRRLASELSQRAGARSRFELGVRATQRGWIT